LPKRCVPPDDLNKARQSFECRIRVGLHVQPVSERKRSAMSATPKHPITHDRSGAHSLHRLVERSRYAACKTGLLRLRTSRAVGLVLHWPLTETSSGCRRLAVHDARQTVNGNL
jgi:hypothetical protein